MHTEAKREQGNFLEDVHRLHLPTLTWHGAPKRLAGTPQQAVRRIAGHTLAAGVAFGGCIATVVGIVPIAKLDVLMLGKLCLLVSAQLASARLVLGSQAMVGRGADEASSRAGHLHLQVHPSLARTGTTCTCTLHRQPPSLLAPPEQQSADRPSNPRRHAATSAPQRTSLSLCHRRPSTSAQGARVRGHIAGPPSEQAACKIAFSACGPRGVTAWGRH